MVLGQTKVHASDEGAKGKDSIGISTWERRLVLGVPRPLPSQTFMLGPESPPKTWLIFSLGCFSNFKRAI